MKKGLPSSSDPVLENAASLEQHQSLIKEHRQLNQLLQTQIIEQKQQIESLQKRSVSVDKPRLETSTFKLEIPSSKKSVLDQETQTLSEMLNGPKIDELLLVNSQLESQVKTQEMALKNLRDQIKLLNQSEGQKHEIQDQLCQLKTEN